MRGFEAALSDPLAMPLHTAMLTMDDLDGASSENATIDVRQPSSVNAEGADEVVRPIREARR